jgi:hypothetical protein
VMWNMYLTNVFRPSPPPKVPRSTPAKGKQSNPRPQLPTTNNPSGKLLTLNGNKEKRKVLVMRNTKHQTRFVGNCQVMEPWTKIACSHCYGTTTVVGYQTHTRGCYLYAVDSGKLEQWEKNRSHKSAYQAG